MLAGTFANAIIYSRTFSSFKKKLLISFDYACECLHYDHNSATNSVILCNSFLKMEVSVSKARFSDKEKFAEILTVQMLQCKVMQTYLRKTITCPFISVSLFVQYNRYMSRLASRQMTLYHIRQCWFLQGLYSHMYPLLNKFHFNGLLKKIKKIKKIYFKTVTK